MIQKALNTSLLNHDLHKSDAHHQRALIQLLDEEEEDMHKQKPMSSKTRVRWNEETTILSPFTMTSMLGGIQILFTRSQNAKMVRETLLIQRPIDILSKSLHLSLPFMKNSTHPWGQARFSSPAMDLIASKVSLNEIEEVFFKYNLDKTLTVDESIFSSLKCAII